MSGASSRTKGHSFERQIAQEMREIGFPNARRNLEYQATEACGVDLEGTGSYLIQCKKHKDYVPVSTIYEIHDECGKIPLLITAGDRKEPMCVLPWRDMKKLLLTIQTLSNTPDCQ